MQVAQVNACGAVVTTAPVKSISLQLGVNPRQALLGGSSVQSTVNGVASYAALSADNEGLGMTLVASTSGLPSTTSAPFEVFDLIAPATAQLFANSASTQSTSLTLEWDAPGDDGNLGSNAAGRYRLCRGLMALQETVCLDSADGGLPSPSVPGFPESATLSGLSPNTSYFVSLRVFDAAGNSSVAFAQASTLP